MLEHHLEGIFNSKLYIRLCCLLGLIKSKYKYPNSHIDIYNYLKENTFYRNEKTLKKAFEQKFREVNFNSKELLLAFKKDKNLFKMISSKLILYMPFGIVLYKIFISKFFRVQKIILKIKAFYFEQTDILLSKTYLS